jgi:hypothetical protein
MHVLLTVVEVPDFCVETCFEKARRTGRAPGLRGTPSGLMLPKGFLSSVAVIGSSFLARHTSESEVVSVGFASARPPLTDGDE